MNIMKILLLIFVVSVFGKAHGALRLPLYYQDHMVLQRGPQRAVLWGFADTEGDTVTAQVTGQGSAVSATVQGGKWKLMLPAITDPGPFVIKVSSADGHVTLNDVLFGDVWLCSGQSNMEFEMKKVMNSSAEIQKGLAFNTIRYMKTPWTKADTPQEDFSYMGMPWTAPTADTLGEFSAVCFLFAEYIQPRLNYPIGLIGTYWGGTSIEAWSPPAAIQSCPTVTHGTEPSCCPQGPEVLYNGKIFALLSNTIKGALWYQGETNADHTAEYDCQQRALIKNWRAEFHRESLGQTSPHFPFGLVQLAGYKRGDDVGGFPGLRWSQTAGIGYWPNHQVNDVFMAVAMDLPDYTSPYDPIHPRYKQAVAERLVRGALNVAYGHTEVDCRGPFPNEIHGSDHELTISYKGSKVPLDIRSTSGFEVCCSGDCNSVFVAQTPAPIVHHSADTITIDTSGCGAASDVQVVRYAWRTSPCSFKKCAVYDSEGLPGPPFMEPVHRAGGGVIGR